MLVPPKRLKDLIEGTGTEEAWVTDGAGDPLLVVITEPSASVAAQVKDLLPGVSVTTAPGTALGRPVC